MPARRGAVTGPALCADDVVIGRVDGQWIVPVVMMVVGCELYGGIVLTADTRTRAVRRL